MQVGVFSTEKVSYQRVFVDQFTVTPGSLIEIAPDIPAAPAPVPDSGMEKPSPAPGSGTGDLHVEPKAGAAESPPAPGVVNPRGGLDLTISSQVDQPVLGAAITIQQEW